MNAEELKSRTKQYAISIARFSQRLPDNPINRVYKSQLIRSSSSVGANYRAARRAKSKPDFINKLKIVEEELDESMFFLELLEPFNQDLRHEIQTMHQEAETILKIIVATIVSSR